jgi:hypothetical protein
VYAGQLGCPSAAGKAGVWMAEENFQHGRMFWREDDRKVYVLYDSGRWERYEDTWREGDPTFSCGTEQHPPTPVRGFGKVWCTHELVRQGLGDATTIEQGDQGAVQDFGDGAILKTARGHIYVLLSDGTWQR